MQINRVQFSVTASAAWAPNIDTHQAWLSWAQAPYEIVGQDDARVVQMPAMLRRRAGSLGKMALEVAYQCLSQIDEESRASIQTIFCSRHGDVARAVELLTNIAHNEPMSPTNFGLAVHNATAGLLTIARQNQANHIALAAGSDSVEHSIIEACSLLADGVAKVLLVVSDTTLPEIFLPFEDCKEQPHAWAWVLELPSKNAMQLSWHEPQASEPLSTNAMPTSLRILQFFLSDERTYVRSSAQRTWCWSRHVD